MTWMSNYIPQKAMYVILIHALHSEHIEAETKWPQFHWRQVQKHFLEWKYFNFQLNLTEICSLGFNCQYVSIGSDNGLEPSRRQAIIWTNADPIHWRIYVAPGGDGLIKSVPRLPGLLGQVEK